MVLSLLAGLLAGVAWADPGATQDALDRMEELLDLRVQEAILDPQDVMPAILVSVQPRYESSQSWYAASAIDALTRAFGPGLRVCEACMAPRAHVEDGRMVYQTGPIGLDEVVRLDEQARGDAPPARSAIWLDEHSNGVAIRIVDLRSGQVLFAKNVDPDLIETQNTERIYTLSEELERRARGDSVTQSFIDFALYPGQHISTDWTDQWGPNNRNLSGVTLSLVDPVVGIGACHYHATQLFDTLVGGKVVLSLPTALVNSVGDDVGDVIDPLVTIVAVARVPFGRSNYGAVITASTNGELGLGVSLMNINLLPVLP